MVACSCSEIGVVMEKKSELPEATEQTEQQEDRRKFLARCGRFAVVTPPAMALLASVAAAPNEAHASTIPGSGSNPSYKPKPWWWPKLLPWLPWF
jgi:hypothetical protein